MHKPLLTRDPVHGAALGSQPTLSRFESTARASDLSPAEALADVVIERHCWRPRRLAPLRRLRNRHPAELDRRDPALRFAGPSALAFAEEATLQKEVSDATFDALRERFSEREIAELVVENAKSNFYDLLNVPLQIHEDGLLQLARRRADARRR